MEHIYNVKYGNGKVVVEVRVKYPGKAPLPVARAACMGTERLWVMQGVKRWVDEGCPLPSHVLDGKRQR